MARHLHLTRSQLARTVVGAAFADDDEGQQLIDDLDRLFFAANRAPRGSIERQASIAVHRAAVADVLRRFHDLFEFDNWLFHNERSYLAGRIDP
jgi:hypothetical protein